MDAVLRSLEQNVYTTSRSDNDAMHALLVAYGFKAAGKPWHSERGAYDLLLHIKLK